MGYYGRGMENAIAKIWVFFISGSKELTKIISDSHVLGRIREVNRSTHPVERR
jgi:hypothetical protein